MNIRFVIIALALAILTASPALAVTKDCFEIASTEWIICDKEGKKQGLVMELVNTCVETMQLKLCLEKEDGEWDCKWHENIEPSGVVKAESCDNTGSYRISACEDKDDCKDE